VQDRKYQTEAQQAVCHDYDKGYRRMLLSAATGTGKTVIFSKLYETLKSRLPGKMLVLAHREELIDQNIDKMKIVNPSLRVDKDMADHRADPEKADVVVASVATLGRKGTRRVEEYDWNSFDKLVVDEAHHATADSYGRVFDLFGSFDPGTHKLLLGVTATPQRGDGSALARVFEKVSYVYSIRKAIEEGWLVDVKGFRINTDTEISGVGTSGGDFIQSELADAVNNSARNQRIVKAWLDNGGNRTTVAFCVDIKHAKELADMFEQSGVAAAAVWGDDPDRALKLQMLREGKIKVLCNCAVLTEGFDCWQIGCVILARPTKSPVYFTQTVGRATRLQDGTGNLLTATGSIKRDCVILDVVDNSSRHSLVTLPTLMGLQNSLDFKGRSVLQSVKSIEEAQKQWPTVDFSKLQDITKLDSYVESVDLFNIKFPQEVEANSELTWFRAANGGYKMLVPKEGDGRTGFVYIEQNMLDQWEITGLVNDKAFRGTRGSMEEAFKAADEQIRTRVSRGTLGLVKREAKWHKDPATPAQLNTLKKVFPWRNFPSDLTKGQASKILNEKFTKGGK
jgi:superfamily II DNA or RNA helicase